MSGYSIDEFLGHQTSSSRGGYLRGWAKRDNHQVDVWLHTQGGIWPLWRHGLPRRVNITREGSPAWEVWGGDYNCWESEKVLTRQFRRDDDGNRMSPPEVCPICKLIEWVRSEIFAERLDWTEKIFRLEADNAADSRIIHAGGITGLFNRRDLGDAEKQSLRDAGIHPAKVWMEVAHAKAQYLFCVVDESNPGNGIQKAIEKADLGDKVKSTIKAQMESLSADGRGPEGNPSLMPYAFRWKYNTADNIEFNKKYSVIPLSAVKCPLRPEVEELIKGELPEVEDDLKKFDAAELRAQLEEYALIDFPWDEIFDSPQPKTTKEEPKAPPRTGPRIPMATPATPSTTSKVIPKLGAPKVAPKVAQKAPPPEPSGDLVACDNCKEPMPIEAKSCPHCKMVYEEEEASPPEPPRIPTRSEALAARKAAAAAKPADAPKAETKEVLKGLAAAGGTRPAFLKGKVTDDLPPEEDDIPF